jgi:hypothetical protein
MSFEAKCRTSLHIYQVGFYHPRQGLKASANYRWDFNHYPVLRLNPKEVSHGGAKTGVCDR